MSYHVGHSRALAVLAVMALAAASPRAADAAIIYSNDNNFGVTIGSPPAPTTFTTTSWEFVTLIEAYHYSDTATSDTISLYRGATPIGTYAAGVSAVFPYPYTYFDAKPDISLAPGTYTIVDGAPSTWSWNSQSGNAGIVMVIGTTVPEPVTMALLGTGLAGLGALRRRRRPV